LNAFDDEDEEEVEFPDAWRVIKLVALIEHEQEGSSANYDVEVEIECNHNLKGQGCNLISLVRADDITGVVCLIIFVCLSDCWILCCSSILNLN